MCVYVSLSLSLSLPPSLPRSPFLALQDWELFNKLGSNSASISHAADLISQLVTNETSRHEDPSLLEKLRREAAHRVMAARGA